MLFDSFNRRDAVMAALHAQSVEDLPHAVEGGDGTCSVYDYLLIDTFVATSVVLGGKGGLPAWRAKANVLVAAHPEATMIVMFHNALPANQQEPPCLIINPGLDALLAALQTCGIALTLAQMGDAQRAALGKAIALRQSVRATMPGTRGAAQAREAQLMRIFGNGMQYNGQVQPHPHAHQPIPVDNDNDDEEDDDAELALALTASLQQPQPQAPPRVLKRTWQDVLEQSRDTPAQPGQAVCIACRDNRASICFLPCAHQAMCDSCARSWMEANPQCPICRSPCEDLIRPFLSGDEPGTARK